MTILSDTELRTDVLTGRQVIVAAQRSSRPSQGLPVPDIADDMYDPFLEGHEHDTPRERLALRRCDSVTDEPGWLLRVVPNRFPAVRDHSTEFETLSAPSSKAVVSATGIHEVVIECPDHRRRLADLSVVEVARVLTAWQRRLQFLCESGNVQAVSIFRNEGVHAGASLSHCHSQILATRFSNRQLRQRMAIVHAFLNRRSADALCPYQQWLQSERTDTTRIVSADSDLVVVCPFASRVSWHVRFCSSNDRCGQAVSFAQVTQSVLLSLAVKLLSTARAIHDVCGSVCFNLALVLPPPEQSELFPWMLELLPRTGQLAGFELLTESDIITTAPESAAARLRDVIRWNETPDVTQLCPPEFHWR
ncbi:MAG: hypothetical protein R3C59_19210 [Planctomycetaceae bacterium]